MSFDDCFEEEKINSGFAALRNVDAPDPRQAIAARLQPRKLRTVPAMAMAAMACVVMALIVAALPQWRAASRLASNTRQPHVPSASHPPKGFTVATGPSLSDLKVDEGMPNSAYPDSSARRFFSLSSRGRAGKPAAGGRFVYFPDALGVGSDATWFAVPPVAEMKRAEAPPNDKRFTAAFEHLARLAILPPWLPQSFDDAKYLQRGEGAYRATTAHLISAYDVGGAHEVLKGFPGEVVLLMDRVPVEIDPKLQPVIAEAANSKSPCVQPFAQSGPPEALTRFFAALRDAIVTPALFPANQKHWEKCVKRTGMLRGGIQIDYIPKQDEEQGLPIEDHVEEVSIWTNGKSVAINVGQIAYPESSAMYQALQPKVVISVKDLNLPYVRRITSQGELMDTRENLVRNRAFAKRTRLYIDFDHGLGAVATVTYPLKPEQIKEACWLGLAAVNVWEDSANAVYETSPAIMAWSGKRQSRAETLKQLSAHRERFLRDLAVLRDAPCSRTLAASRHAMLVAMYREKQRWDIAWPFWKSALGAPVSKDYDVTGTNVEKALDAKGLLNTEFFDDVHDPLMDRAKELGIAVEEQHGD